MNISSGAGRRGLPYRIGYCSAKAGQVGMTFGMALELGPAHPRQLRGPRRHGGRSDRPGHRRARPRSAASRRGDAKEDARALAAQAHGHRRRHRGRRGLPAATWRGTSRVRCCPSTRGSRPPEHVRRSRTDAPAGRVRRASRGGGSARHPAPLPRSSRGGYDLAAGRTPDDGHHDHIDGRAGRRQPGDGRPARGDAPSPGSLGGGPAPPRPHRGRDGDRQGPPRPAAPPGRPPRGRAVRRDQLRRDPRDPARVRDVRLRARRVHGRRQPKPGFFEAAQRGHVLPRRGRASSPRASRAKLLKAIEDREVRRLGATRSIPLDVWIIAATSEDLGRPAQGGRFQEDLYHRLAVLTSGCPPSGHAGTTSSCWPSASWRGPAPSTVSRQGASTPTRGRACSRIPGPATCVSSRT